MTKDKAHIEETILKPSKIERMEIVYEDKYKKIEKIRAHFPGFKKEYFISDFGPKAAVVITHSKSILLVRQYRLLINDLSYEIPGGAVHENESPLDAAIRECEEETGITCLNLKPLINFNPDLEYTKNYTHVFHTECVKEVVHGDKRCVWVPLKDCMKMIFSEKISDSLSVIAILAYHAKFGTTDNKRRKS